ncbi:FAD:protein FMN transferase [Chitinophaga japonensis]|uniref:FAD:protein FMN transferase n=1 Tax=Chitinophaga japonensis TaxID=104662 RepID=A0A562T4C3_CHIJA|nr:FAD:protein FMN transferase [Chitinophaga japonensis]TWI88084.1 thiamine biosynthesis lipoprotein [Chitinophaga japonensis]
MPVKSKVQQRLMGSDFELIVVADNEAASRQRLYEGVAEIQRIEQLLTAFNDTSQTALLNKQAGTQPVTVDAEVYALISRCIRLSALTQGAFDITAGALKALYNFRQGSFTMPDAATLSQTLKRVGYRHIALQPGNRVFLQRKGMRIGFGAVGKGYAADRVKALWTAAGITSGVINASGDLCAWGRQPDGTPWKVGIADPDHADRVLFWLPVENAAVATSGNYEQYFERNGVRYSHNIDPVSGQPVPYIKSVTVVSPSAELSDALATAVTVMGKDAGLYLVAQLPQVHCLIIDGQNRVFQSKHINIHAKA